MAEEFDKFKFHNTAIRNNYIFMSPEWYGEMVLEENYPSSYVKDEQKWSNKCQEDQLEASCHIK